jgi:outer membrane protein X
MKKILFAALIAITGFVTLHAEVGDMSAGFQFSYASKNSMIGLGVNYQIEVVRNLRVEPEFIYYFENKHLSDYNLNLNLHYLIPTYSGLYIYPMAGFSYVNFKDTAVFTTHTNRYGANVGLGVEYRINDRLKFYTEQRFHIIKDWNESVTALGLKYTFRL